MEPLSRISFCKDSLGEIDHSNLLDIQVKSFRKFILSGGTSSRGGALASYFKNNFPVKDSNGEFELHFVDYYIGYPKSNPMECIKNGITYSVSLKVRFKLIKKSIDGTKTEEEIEEDIFLGGIPYMTDSGSFIINGIERVVVSLIHKSVGVFFSKVTVPVSTDQFIYSAKLIPTNGPWIDFSVSVNGVIYAYIDRKKKVCFTTFLRALGYDSDADILTAFGLAFKIKNTKEELGKYSGAKLMNRIIKKWSCDVVDEVTGEVKETERAEVLVDRGTIINDRSIPSILASGTDELVISRDENDTFGNNIIYNTLEKDNTNSTIEAAYKVYKKLRGVDGIDDASVTEAVKNIFFDPMKYSLGEIGRYKINKKLNLDIPFDHVGLTKQDIISIVKHLIYLISVRSQSDDIDHLSNRRIRTVSEQFNVQFGMGVARLARIVSDRLSNREKDDIKIVDLVNTKIFTNVLSGIFYANNSLSQFMDQVNPLSEVTHKRRISAIGQGGLPKDTRVGFEARDVHYTYESNICPVETPEGANIGLITHLASCAVLNEKGFLESPYRKVKDGIVDISGKCHYLAVEDKDNCNIAQATIKIDENGKILDKKIKIIHKGDILEVSADQVHYVQVSSVQIVSISTSLIPFLEHNDASRALMGANMQRQSVPLLKPKAPIVGSGMEKYVAKSFGGLIYAEGDGEVIYVDATKISIKYKYTEKEKLCSFESAVKDYDITRLYGTNQKTFMNFKPIVREGDIVKNGDCLIEGYGTENGELALGTNLKVAFLSKRGYTFEDAIVISERLVKEDVLTSIYVEEYTLDIRDTKLGPEEFTSEIPNIGDEAIKNLDENGMIKVGSVVGAGDIIIGKLTPKSDGEPSPEEKLLKAIFGSRAGEVRDVSLRMPPSMSGVVIETKLLERKASRLPDEDRAVTLANKKKEKERLRKKYLYGANKIRKVLVTKLVKILDGVKSCGVEHISLKEIFPKDIVFNEAILSGVILEKQEIIEKKIKNFKDDDFELVRGITTTKWVEDQEKNDLIDQILINYLKNIESNIASYKKDLYELEVGDDLPLGVLKRAKVLVAQLRKIKVGDKMSGRHGNKGVVSKIVREEDMPFLENGDRVDVVLNPLGISSRMNIGQLFEAALGLAGMTLNRKYASPVFSGATEEEIQKEMKDANLAPLGKQDLYDGLTGEKFLQKVNVGVMYMLKLNHMAEDKVHAIATEGYSLVTNQPLRGKSQFGGQRVGEMEGWALEAYGAAHTLREMFTIKSDDVDGRSMAYEHIIKGKNISYYGVPEAFKVMINFFRGLNLEVGVF